MPPLAKKPRSVGTPPTPYLYREVKPDWPGLFENLADLFGKFKPDKWREVIPTTYKSLCSLFRLKERTIEEEVFLLVKRSLARAIEKTLGSLPEVTKQTSTGERKEAAKHLDARLREQPIELTDSFFERPHRAKIVGVVAGFLADWLRTFGFANKEVEDTVRLFPYEFLHSFRAEAENAKEYPAFVKQHPNSLLPLSSTECAWYEYYAKLQIRANPEVLDLGVFLDDVYVELRAYTEPSTDGTGGVEIESSPSEKKTPRRVGLLRDLAEAWIEADSDAIFVISGGPGSGKSAFARRFSAWLAWAGPNPWRVLYIPLHRFKAWRELRPAVGQFAASEIALSGSNSIDLFPRNATEDERLLIVFDGLDELSQQGAVGEELARHFYGLLDGFVKEINGENVPVRMKVMVCGRPVAVSLTAADVLNAERVRYVLPYLIDEEFSKKTEWVGRPHLVQTDQRDEWWAKYGQASGQPEIDKMPDEIRTKKLDALTAEPILNGLVAKCLKNPNRKITPETNRAQIYEWMLHDVLQRVHDTSGNVIIPGKKSVDVAELLEVVAVSAWHNGEIRATTKTRVREHCSKVGMEQVLDKIFPDKAKSDITPIFLSFYFQEAHERVGQERAFEFSHKSYGEYLVARRLNRFFHTLHKNLGEGNWTEEEALKRWAQLFGPAQLTWELHEFVAEIVDLDHDFDAIHIGQTSRERRQLWRKDFCRLFGAVTRRGMPMEQLGLSNYREMARQSRHAMIAFFIIHSACFRFGEAVYAIDWLTNQDNDVSKGDLFLRLMGHPHIARANAIHFQRGWDWRNVDLTGANLSGANLTQTNLTNANLLDVNLNSARLTGTNLSKSNLFGATFVSANLMFADLSGANLSQANLVSANVRGANLEGANLARANLSLDQLLVTRGDPAIMPDGKPPKKNWRKPRAKKRKKPPSPPSDPQGQG